MSLSFDARRGARLAVAVLAVVAAVAAVGGCAAGRHTGATAATGGWRGVTAPTGLTGDTELVAVTATDPAHAWAVGSSTVTDHSVPVALAYDGHRWTRLSVPDAPDGELHAASAETATDVWLVGNRGTGDATTGLIEHWDGQRWTRQEAPAGTTSVDRVQAFAPGDVWAVGAGDGGPFLLHDNGAGWVRQTGALDRQDAVAAVSGSSGADVWAVGGHVPDNGAGEPDTPAVAHWDGSAWREMPSPTVQDGHLTAVTTDGRGSAWAVGRTHTGKMGGDPIAEHWDGQKWSRLPIPSGSGAVAEAAGGELRSVAPDGHGGIWAVGENGLLHWDGHRWTTGTLPSAGRGHSDTASGVARVPNTTKLWLVGTVRATDGSGDSPSTPMIASG